MRTVALATSETWPDLAPDDGALVSELARTGVRGVPAVWSDPSVEWSEFEAVVIRSCWDYHVRAEEFTRWLDSVSVPLFNPRDVVRWNMHKSYLLDLQAKGATIPRTQILREAGTLDFEGSIIVKPSVSASAHETHRFDRTRDAVGAIMRLLQRGEVVIQEFVPEIVTRGEWSLIFIDGEFSHAVKKEPKAGDFRVQEELGGSADPADAPSHVIDEARRILALARGGALLYARVDVVDRPGGVTLMELELIEPHLFFGTTDGSSRRFAEAISRRVPSTSGT